MKRMAQIAILAAISVCVMTMTGFLKKPVILDENGIFQIGGNYFKELGALNTTALERFSKKIDSLYATFIDGKGSGKVFYSLIPDKYQYFDAQTHNIKYDDFNKMAKYVNARVKHAQYIDLAPALSFGSYYATDSHWRQDKLGEVLATLGSAMDFSAELSGFSVQRYAPFVGAYSRLAKTFDSEDIIWLTNAATDASVVSNLQHPDKTQVYDGGMLDSDYAYDVFLSGATPIVTVVNPLCISVRELVVFGDSYASSLVPLLLDSYKSVTVIDLRYIFSALLNDYVDFAGKDTLFLYSAWVANSVYLK